MTPTTAIITSQQRNKYCHCRSMSYLSLQNPHQSNKGHTVANQYLKT